ncbi:MAG: alpha/beta fold hydrolase [Hyphomicrobiales bacterium]
MTLTAGGTTARDITIPATDGFALSATLFPGGESAVVIMSSAAAVPRRFYRHFAAHLAARLDATVITYDYRGVGQSRPASLVGFEASMRDWAAKDFAGVVDFVRRTLPDRPIRLVGHSFGGLALGLTDRNAFIERAVFVATISGYWGNVVGAERLRVWLFAHLLGPLATLQRGYLPGAALGIGEDLPRGVFADWGRWIRSRHFHFEDPDLPETRHYGDYRGEILAFGFTDDPWGPPRSVDAVLSRYVSARREHRHPGPADVGAKAIGHMGFFRPEFRETLWRQAADWLASGG